MESVINNNDSGYSALSEEEICRSMKISQESKTPYSDATQVRKNGHIFPYNSYTFLRNFIHSKKFHLVLFQEFIHC